jgi:hypothetical protein
MTVPVTLNLTEDLYQRAANFANLLGKDVMEVLVDTLTLSLARSPFPPASASAPQKRRSNGGGIKNSALELPLAVGEVQEEIR